MLVCLGCWLGCAENKYRSKKSFREKLINCESMENGSMSPDFVLADYLQDALNAFDKAVQARESFNPY